MLFYIEQQLGLAAKAKFEVTNFTTDQIGQHECVFFYYVSLSQVKMMKIIE
jgi:hypothetical protein